MYICCIEGWEPKVFELQDFAENKISKIHPHTRVQISEDFVGETFYSHFFNAREIRIPFLGCRYVNRSVQWLDVTRLFSEMEILRWLGLKTPSCTAGLPTLLWFRIFLSDGVKLLMVFLSASALLHAEPITIAFNVFMLSRDKLLRESSTREFSWTFVTRSFPMTPMTADLNSPTPTDNLRILSKMWGFAFGSLLGSTCLLESLIVSTCSFDS